MRVDEIERYLAKQMSPEEREHFEKEMEENPSLKFDMQLVVCVIVKTREEWLRRERALVDRMCQSRPHDKKRYVATMTVFFVSAATMVACLFFGIRAIVNHSQRHQEVHGVQGGKVNQESQDNNPIVYNFPEGRYDVDGDRMFPSLFNSPKTVQDNRGMKKDMEKKENADPSPSVGEPHRDPVVSEETPSPSKEQAEPVVSTETSRLGDVNSLDSHVKGSEGVERYLSTATSANGVWGAVERSFWTGKSSLQVDVVLNSRERNTDIDEEKFRYKTYLITDAGKKKTLYDFKYGTTSRTSFFLEKGATTRICLYFNGVRNKPAMLRELHIPAIHQEFVFRNIVIN